MNEFVLTRLFERKLKGEMSEQELKEFDTLVESDPDAKQKFLEHKQFFSAFKKYGDRKALKEVLEEAHADYEYQSEKPKKASNKKWYYAIAASLTGIVLISVSFIIGMNYNSDKNESTYLATSRKLQSLEAEQKVILKKLSAGSSTVAVTASAISGTGIMISSDGYLITNLHLIKGADSVIVYNNSNQPLKARVVSSDPLFDLAMLKIEDSTLSDMMQIPYAFRSSELDLADAVFSLGYPGDDLVYGQGNISSLAGYRGDSLAYQISIPVNPGNSGGPVIDEQGNIVGIISGKQTSREGMGFAIKSTYIKEFISKATESEDLKLNTKNSLKGLSRKDKIKKLKPYVFQVRAFQ